MSTLVLGYSGTYITINRPIYGYKTVLSLPLDVQRLDNGLYDTYDAGSAYDVRTCECTFRLSAAETNSLYSMIDDTGRGQNITMILPASSGFHPFGPDKGPTGTYTVSMEIIDSTGVMGAPYLYFDTTIRMINQGAYPSYTAGVSSDIGSITVGTVDNVRFPPDWFEPENRLGVSVSHGMAGAARYVDRGAFADSHDTRVVFTIGQEKAAALIAYIAATARGGTFTLSTADNQYAFNVRSGGAGSYTVRLVSGNIGIRHIAYNQFDIDIMLSREAIL